MDDLESPQKEGGGERTLKINDTRKIDAVSKRPITSKNRKDVSVDPNYLRKIIKEAKWQGVDPYTALAMAHQESNFNINDIDLDPWHIIDQDFTDPSNDIFHIGIKTIKDKLNYGRSLGKKDEASILQAFNGYGKIGRRTEGKNNTKFYGLDVSKGDLDLAKNPVYGKRIMDIRDNIWKKNPEVIKLVETELRNDPELKSPSGMPDNYKPLSSQQRLDWNKFLDYVNK